MSFPAQPHAPQLLHYPEHHVPLVHFIVGLRCGSLVESRPGQGTFYAMMQMLLRGTKQRGRQAFNSALETLGSSVQASIGYEMAMLRGSCLREHLPATFALLCEAITQPAFSEAELQLYQKEAIDHLHAARDDDDYVVSYFSRQALYGEHPRRYASMGIAEQIGLIQPADLQAMHAYWCQQLLSVGFAGSIDAGQARDLQQQLWAQLPTKPPERAVRVDVVLPTHSQIVLVDKPNRQQAQLRLSHFGPPLQEPPSSSEHEALQPLPDDEFWLGMFAFGGTFTSPFCQSVREQRGWSYTAHVETWRRGHGPQAVVWSTAPQATVVAECMALHLKWWRTLQRNGLAEADVERAMRYLHGRAPFYVANAFLVLELAMGALLGRLSLHGALHFSQIIAQIVPSQVVERVSQVLANRCFLLVLCGEAKVLQPAIAAEPSLNELPLQVIPYDKGLLQKGAV